MCLCSILVDPSLPPQPVTVSAITEAPKLNSSPVFPASTPLLPLNKAQLLPSHRRSSSSSTTPHSLSISRRQLHTHQHVTAVRSPPWSASLPSVAVGCSTPPSACCVLGFIECGSRCERRSKRREQMIAKCASPIAIAIAVHNSHSHGSSFRPIKIIIKSCASSTSSSNLNTSEHLRSQLDHLHAEAHTTITKANNARMRLLRLSEAAEKLQKQAAISIQRGDENGAREMLFQRKKVLQALEKSKSRIELLDELSTKLSEAISLKESQLIGFTMNMEDTIEDASSPIRIVAPKEEEVLGDFS
ncbi:hypothetical protein PIB30_054996 [Stylosanthes scabra]|uniref:Uncharacterized protein n=1 Tax=Stylosanthes scabra TaxID=79078 RepID=A0ABU6XK50_9FABA|nr:hypothetical protein [Stylosanthes scabra]